MSKKLYLCIQSIRSGEVAEIEDPMTQHYYPPPPENKSRNTQATSVIERDDDIDIAEEERCNRMLEDNPEQSWEDILKAGNQAGSLRSQGQEEFDQLTDFLRSSVLSSAIQDQIELEESEMLFSC